MPVGRIRASERTRITCRPRSSDQGLKGIEPTPEKPARVRDVFRAVWWRCHRRMIADAEAARGIPVKHLTSEKAAKPHAITEFAWSRRKVERP